MTLIEIVDEVRIVKRLDEEFRKNFDRQYAFDFNVLNFFKVGENKLSELLAYFINPKSEHGQKDAFLNIFLDVLGFEVKDRCIVEVKCEKVINDQRRIDLYIKFKQGEILAIENKVWAKDQYRQLEDYYNFIRNEYKNDFRLYYLNPYGRNPSEDSLSKDLENTEEYKKHYKVIRYTNEIVEILSGWITVCEAENVVFFLKQFKQYIINTFIGKDTFNTKYKMKELIYKNPEEIKSLVNIYTNIESDLIKQFEKISELLKIEINKANIDSSLLLKIEGPFNNLDAKIQVFKVSVGFSDERISVRFYRDGVILYSSHDFLQASPEFLKCFELTSLNKNVKLHKKNDNGSYGEPLPKHEIIDVVMSQFAIAVNGCLDYIKSRT